MVILRMLDNVFADFLFVAKKGFMVVVRSEVAVNHLGVVTHSYLRMKVEDISICNFISRFSNSLLNKLEPFSKNYIKKRPKERIFFLLLKRDIPYLLLFLF